ncbi:hypothetical protein OpiT1DRAFT_05015 [Opitutaceae bacterium TAV1]|nr:hypothetical protein OpiT1DRAFT_05015 [Opitutaceae bacterium TAV1]
MSSVFLQIPGDPTGLFQQTGAAWSPSPRPDFFTTKDLGRQSRNRRDRKNGHEKHEKTHRA